VSASVTAQAYGDEASVGRAVRESGLDRSEVFLTTKFHPGRSDPLREIAYRIDRLGVDYVDLYLVHWPQGGATWAWPEMEHARAQLHAVDRRLELRRRRPRRGDGGGEVVAELSGSLPTGSFSSS
jgi:aryl-alcohol dehydrogenase-like predicted oxidoreductase